MSKPFHSPDNLLPRLANLARLGAERTARQADAAVALRRRLDHARLRAAAARSELQAGAAAARVAAGQRLAETLQHLEARKTTRGRRLEQAGRQVRRAAAERVDAEEGRRKFELQREMLRATRERDAGIDRANAVHSALQQRLESLTVRLDHLERETRRLLTNQGAKALEPLTEPPSPETSDPAQSPDTLADQLEAEVTEGAAALLSFRRLPLPALSRAWPATLVLVLSPAITLPVLQALKVPHPRAAVFLLGSLALAGLALVLHLVGRHLARPAAFRLAGAVGRARHLAVAATTRATATHQAERERLETAHGETTRRCDAAWQDVLRWLETTRTSGPGEADARAARALLRFQHRTTSARSRAEQEHEAALRALEAGLASDLALVEQKLTEALQEAEASHAETERTVLASWREKAGAELEGLLEFRRLACGPEFSPEPLPPVGTPWQPPSSQTDWLRFGEIDLHLPTLLGHDPAQALGDGSSPGETLQLPLALALPSRPSLMVEADPTARTAALGTLNHLLARALASAPPGRISFTLLDPVGLGESFAPFSQLADEAPQLIDGRIWTQSSQFEDRLAELGEHLEKVIQMYLRAEFPTIAEYNLRAGSIAERYRFLVVADFPVGFTETALRRLAAIATSGARCGVFLLLHLDPSRPLPADFPIAALREATLCFRVGPSGSATLHGAPQPIPGARLQLAPGPAPAALADFLPTLAHRCRDSFRVEVPFDRIAPEPTQRWSLDTATELRVPIGRTGATKLQYLALGRATRQHALIAGKTGSGKSTLFHVLITNLALWCAPDQVEFYLVDFKKGVEFKAYATHRLPHARVIAIESDREFGLSVLQRLDSELRRRGELFRATGVQDLPGYRRAAPGDPLPRTLLLVDEFQEFFVEEDRIAQNAAVLLDRIVRQGRAFGIHVILGSQTLGGAYTVARSTLGQMAVRIALQCNEADALLIMDEENPAPRLLSRPGEALYNDEAGARAGNSPFQVVWLPDETRERLLGEIRRRADALPVRSPEPFVFEGDAPADVRETGPLHEMLLAEAPASIGSVPPRIWLGAPNAIKAPTSVAFHRRAADNLLAVGQQDDALRTLLGLSILALAAQFRGGRARLCLLDSRAQDSREPDPLVELAGESGDPPLEIAGPEAAGPLLERLAAELRARTTQPLDPSAPPRFLFIQGLQHFRSLRPEDEFAFRPTDGPSPPSELLREILTEGPAHGFHSLIACDTWNTVTRFLGRKLLAEFSMRVLFQMSANDSASLVDTPEAARLGMHRALLRLDREGSAEIFRPHAPPDADWLDAVRHRPTAGTR